jgi:hypothetical protein
MKTVATRATHIQGDLQWVTLVNASKGLVDQELAGMKAQLILLKANEVCLAGARAFHLISIRLDVG